MVCRDSAPGANHYYIRTPTTVFLIDVDNTLLDNETFAYRFLGGWIGTTGTQTKVLDPIVREIVATGRTVTIAVKRHLTQEERQAAHLASAAEFDEDALRSV